MTMEGGGGTKQACAACKYQRRKCVKNCRLARYFPGDQPKMFQNVHRLFGVSSIIKILNQVVDEDKDKAMSSIIFESDIRAKYPVHGCLGLIRALQKQLQAEEAELHHVIILLATYKEQYQFYQTSTSSSSSHSEVQGMDVNNHMVAQPAGNAGDFYVGIDNEDVKPFLRIDEQNQNHRSYNNNSMLFKNDLGNIQALESICIHDDAPFVAIYPHPGKKPYPDSKGKEVCNLPKIVSGR